MELDGLKAGRWKMKDIVLSTAMNAPVFCVVHSFSVLNVASEHNPEAEE